MTQDQIEKMADEFCSKEILNGMPMELAATARIGFVGGINKSNSFNDMKIKGLCATAEMFRDKINELQLTLDISVAYGKEKDEELNKIKAGL